MLGRLVDGVKKRPISVCCHIFPVATPIRFMVAVEEYRFMYALYPGQFSWSAVVSDALTLARRRSLIRGPRTKSSDNSGVEELLRI